MYGSYFVLFALFAVGKYSGEKKSPRSSIKAALVSKATGTASNSKRKVADEEIAQDAKSPRGASPLPTKKRSESQPKKASSRKKSN